MKLIKQQEPYGWGYTAITTEGEAVLDTMMDFGILRLKKGESQKVVTEKETAYLLMEGAVQFTYDGQEVKGERNSVFHESCTCLHVPAGTSVEIAAETDVELAVTATVNEKHFAPVFYSADDVRSEQRGKGTMQETSTRIVRTVFDKSNAPDANLVLGEVINYPGKWSSYPPHHHPQPEIYHYRFLPEQGFGLCVLDGDEVLKVEHRSTVKIVQDEVHPQSTAPGYAMYYLWVIRHLDDDPYIMPTFVPEHEWVRNPDAEIFPDRRK
ncbi:MAG: 5-deoxy-glucuronate isomerase [Bacillota bacterium]|mgnify:FL=1|nr:5-deoxy-glucuronate isomerase [Bacillota bacterium]